MLPRLGLFCLPLWVEAAYAAFGLTDADGAFTVDTGAGLVYSVNQGSCDLTSIYFSDTELQYPDQGSHIGSGLGSATVTATQDGDYIVVSCVTETLTQYLVARSGDNAIYMGTYTSAEPEVGELRFIARLLADVVPNEEPFGAVSNTGGSSETVEGSDVFVVDGETRSKFYSSERFIDDQIHCVSGDSIRVCMIMPGTAYEGSSGGPFFRDINSNNGGDYNSLYWYMNSGHVQTEEYRMGLHGPYAMVFTDASETPSADLDLSFFGDLGVEGFVGESDRGDVTGVISLANSSAQAVVHWFNKEAQYWAYADGDTYTSPLMKEGTYTMNLYQVEYLVGTEEGVTVSAGSTTNMDIAGNITTGNTIWRIGEWDGQPTGFRNAENQLRMHPSDSRMEDWGPLTYTVGTSSSTDFPMAVFASVNNPVTVEFDLTSDQLGAATLRIGTTLAFAGGRPQPTVNDDAFDPPAAPTEIDSRGVTRGAYRGYGEVYDYDIAEGTLVEGTNTITISVASGSSGDTFLSPNFIFDAVELFN
ncbi:hypothetical protein FQN54_003945 [Arachnomyces sp. PD_36]|nr:hypothetical protein FQN54_003945 [Arachnomyces sp. PD_36]